MCISNAVEGIYRKMKTFLDVEKQFKEKFIYQRHFVPIAVLRGCLHSWFVSTGCGVTDTWLLWGKHKHLHKTVTFWMSVLPCSVREVIYCWRERKISVGHLPCEKKGAFWRFLWIETYIINLFSSQSTSM